MAKELVNLSKETFWLDTSVGSSSLCDLERLARSIFHRHTQNIPVFQEPGTISGAEWWVQVKSVTYPKENQALDHNNGSEAVDLHFDKDEALAESFGLGSFPTLSTVTYLSDSTSAPPTLVFSRRYEEQDDITQILVSHPRQGKHLIFDGRLLHGAPSHYALRQPKSTTEEAQTTVAADRVTFLVNIWTGHKPVGVEPLPNEIRKAIQRRVVGQSPRRSYSDKISKSTFERLVIEERTLATESDLGLTSSTASPGRLELPFVGKGATWDDGEEDDVHMILSMHAPPVDPDCDTTVFHFAPALAAVVDAPASEKEREEESEEEDDDESSEQ